jgi:uncharacterized RDD family membrane protein YckC
MTVDYEDRISIPTPEGVELELVLAGVGSRLVATLIDLLIMGSVLFALWILGFAAVPSSEGGGVLGAILIVLTFLVVFGYDVAFETLASGRTPGKRAAGLRVVRLGGEPPGFLAAAIRNLLRLIDLLPAFYAVGVISILVTSRNQRLGDLAAGTLVVRERRPAPAHHGPPANWATADRYSADRLAAWDVSAVTSYDLVTVRRFLERRNELQPHARAHLAWDLAGRLRPKVMGAPDTMSPEEFLESLAKAKSSRS